MSPAQELDPNIGLVPKVPQMDAVRKIGVAIFALGLLFFFIALFGVGSKMPWTSFILSVGLMSAGGIVYFVRKQFARPAGIDNDGVMFASISSRGTLAWMVGVMLTGFYVIWYWWPHLLNDWYRMSDPLSRLLRGKDSDQWFFYGTMYTVAILVMGLRALVKYRHSAYQVVRTLSVMFFQLVLAYLMPAILAFFKEPERYLNYSWPLSYSDFYPNKVFELVHHPGRLGVFILVWGLMFTFILTPILTYFYGKRWYCSWVCGCGGLANTFGDPFRQLSDKSERSWKLEQKIIYPVLGLITLTTIFLWVSYLTGQMGYFTKSLSGFYGFMIGSIFSGVIGTGFYPILGTRVWCRFGCPMAGILGILQRTFSRFRITTNGAQCISCGNCSTYCEMGIDVRSYAQKGENIVRASCVGCGLCSAVCPRGVLNLENGPEKGRINSPLSLVGERKSGSV